MQRSLSPESADRMESEMKNMKKSYRDTVGSEREPGNK
jgi:hypothetical protein